MSDREIDNGMTRCKYGGVCECCGECYESRDHDYYEEVYGEDDAVLEYFEEKYSNKK